MEPLGAWSAPEETVCSLFPERRRSMSDEHHPEAFDLHRWFEERELEICPRCHEARLTPAAPSLPGSRVCLSCGILQEPVPEG